MRLSEFLRGRWLYIAAYGAFAILAVTVVQLDLRLSGASLQYANVLYILLLGAAGLAVFLWTDYSRQKEFMDYLGRFTGEGPLDSLSVLPEPVTPEQRLFAGAWRRLYGRLRSEAAAERDRGRRNVELITQWAHHMKTPVAIIDLELQRFERDGAPSPAEGGVPAALLESIREENRRLDGALQALLNTVRIGDFAADFKVERIDLDEFVRRLINEHRREFVAHNVFPALEIAGGGAEQGSSSFQVESDTKWLRFALQQVISNAIKYSSCLDIENSGAAEGASPRRGDAGDPGDEDPPRLRGEGVPGSGGGDPHGDPHGDPLDEADRAPFGEGTTAGRVVFRLEGGGEKAAALHIIDDGIGIPAEDVPRVFEPFFTGTPGRHHSRSTGMGLYLAREVCHRLGHPIGLESTPGEGTRVTIIFPDADTIFTGLEREAAAGHHAFGPSDAP